LPEDAQVLGEFHALVVRHGKSCCGKSPFCETCPLGAHCSFANSATLPFRNGS
jgi:endonuclease-3 related protein